MSDPIVTISGQRVYPRGQSPETREKAAQPDWRDADGRQPSLTEMSPSGWASGSSDETFEAGLPFLGALVAVITLTLVALLLLRRRRSIR